MLPEAFLLTNGQVAIAGITVAGILGLLRNQGSKKLTAAELTGIRFMIEHAIVMLFMSYLPVVLKLYITDTDRTLSWASAAFAAVLVALQFLAIRKLMAVKPRRPRDLVVWLVPANLARDAATRIRGTQPLGRSLLRCLALGAIRVLRAVASLHISAKCASGLTPPSSGRPNGFALWPPIMSNVTLAFEELGFACGQAVHQPILRLSGILSISCRTASFGSHDLRTDANARSWT